MIAPFIVASVLSAELWSVQRLADAVEVPRDVMLEMYKISMMEDVRYQD
jgi:hypothetical protein